jgi:hypothetical protein
MAPKYFGAIGGLFQTAAFETRLPECQSSTPMVGIISLVAIASVAAIALKTLVAGCGSHLAGDSPVDHRHAHNRVGFGRERPARRDSPASNAPPAVDRSVALGPPAVARRRDLQCQWTVN